MNGVGLVNVTKMKKFYDCSEHLLVCDYEIQLLYGGIAISFHSGRKWIKKRGINTVKLSSVDL